MSADINNKKDETVVNDTTDGQTSNIIDINSKKNIEDKPKKAPKKMFKKVSSILSTVLVCILAVAAIFLVTLKIIGGNVFIIQSSSMAPKYPVGSIVITVPISYEDIEVGDVISYVLNEDLTVVTHRVVAIDTENGTVVTQGDNSDANDGAIAYKNIVGEVILCIPLIGYAIAYISEYKFAVIAGICGLILVFAVFKIYKRYKKTA